MFNVSPGVILLYTYVWCSWCVASIFKGCFRPAMGNDNGSMGANNSVMVKMAGQMFLEEDINPIIYYSDLIRSLDSLKLDERIFLSILVSTGCRISEASDYSYLGRVSSSSLSFSFPSSSSFLRAKPSGCLVKLRLPVRKKRSLVYRQLCICCSLFGLSSSDYVSHVNSMRSIRTYFRLCYRVLGMNARDYRRSLALYVLRRKNIVYVKSMLCHTDIRTTEYYLRSERADFLEILSL